MYEWTIATYVGAGALAGCGFLASNIIAFALLLSCKYVRSLNTLFV